MKRFLGGWVSILRMVGVRWFLILRMGLRCAVWLRALCEHGFNFSNKLFPLCGIHSIEKGSMDLVRQEGLVRDV